ncbi:TRAP transporter substrate-binding protein [Oricola thermophila]|uniref:TRAP transporter substrate-binding protein n=1 Tax=Oricola thermophila TaxID=2742145 RepID=A0A6N1VEX0_9HYPH|nr:TRAP transporter substrate-binding protein [Oricola thermophila]QKV19248.1 TRAP transporter substrate-binding protein [Oricola thermophila]
MIKKILLAGVACALAAGVSVAEPVRLKMASTYPSSLTQLGTLGKLLEENITEASGGDIQLKFFEPGALVPALEVFDAVKNGSVDAAWSTPGYWQGKEPALALFAAVPFGPSAGEFLAWLLNGGGEARMQEIYAKHNIHSIICAVIAPEASGWFREEITSLDQLQGKKMRFFGLGAKVMQKLGVDTQLLAGADIYPALERGTIDATEFSMPAIDLNLGFYQVAKHYYFPGWHQQSTMFELMINKEKWDAMSDSQRKLITMACRANIALGFAEGEAIQGKALTELKANGVEIHRWPQEILDKLQETWNEVAAEQAAADATFAETWESLQAFREEYRVWAELGYLK